MSPSLRARVVTFATLLAIAYLVYKFVNPPWTIARIAGLVIMFPALALLTIARLQLGSSFSITPQARKLITYGIYSRIRNPIYVFSTIVFIGLFLFLEMPYLFLLLLVLIPLQLYRARAEARILEQRFGDEYRQYKSGTWF